MFDVKELARSCFLNAKQAKRAENALIELFECDGGLIGDLFDHCLSPMRFITPAYIAESDQWLDDFYNSDDFEAFWNKYYEGRI